MNKYIIPEHWTLRYICNKLKLLAFEHRNPNLPWLTKSAIEFLDDFLKKSDSGVEFGSGRSTLWLSPRVKALTSVEHYEGWYNKVKELLKEKDIENVNLLFSSQEECFDEEDQDNSYVKALNTFEDNSLDFVLVDGIFRSSCACEAICKVRPGGFIIVDNVERYIVMQTFSPEAIKSQSEMTPAWKIFQKKTKEWRTFHTSNGVTDTSFFFKP
jgi:predicted O-methyltransferase YrrM